MIALGVILLILGYVLGMQILITIGMILLLVGVVLFIMGSFGQSIGGRRYWY